MDKLVIANMMRCKNKQSFFALHQIQTKIFNVDPELQVEFHILWDNTDPNNPENQDDPKWAALIEKHIKNIHSYDREFLKNYMKTVYADANVARFDAWPAAYHILIAHYLRRVKLYDYYLIYDDDVLINYDFADIVELMKNKIPVLISEPMNVNCDKVLFNSFRQLFGEGFAERYQSRNPLFQGFNAGFQGIDLTMYDAFLSVDRFHELLSLILFKSIYREDGTEIWGDERFLLDTQQQSMFSLMNVVLSKNTPHILDEEEYYVVPNYGYHPRFGQLHQEDEMDGWIPNLKSKISHFIGHTRGEGKPRVFLAKMNEYLTNAGFDV